MSGLRERKRRKTEAAIHDAAMELFSRHGYGEVTVAQIAAAAEVSRATVFTYYPAKEHIVLGEAARAVDGLAAALADCESAEDVVAAVGGWVGTLVGWMEPELLLQLRLAAEVPAVAAARSSLQREIETVIAAALERTLGAGQALAARLVAGSLVGALAALEQRAAARLAAGRRPPGGKEVEAHLAAAAAFVAGGLAAIDAGAGAAPGG